MRGATDAGTFAVTADFVTSVDYTFIRDGVKRKIACQISGQSYVCHHTHAYINIYLVACTLPVHDINFTVDFFVPEIIAAAIVHTLVTFSGCWCCSYAATTLRFLCLSVERASQHCGAQHLP